MPAAFDKILATCRSRGIYCAIVLQSLAQIKKLFKDGAWEGLAGNCDTFLFLGGNEQSTQKYVSEMLGKWTIDKRSVGETTGRNGSGSKNYDVLGRELLTSTEVRKLSNSKCICLVRGQDPILDDKLKIWKTKEYLKAKALGKCTTQSPADVEGVEMIGEESIAYYRTLEKKGEKVKLYEVDLEEFLSYDFSEDDGEEFTQDEIQMAFQDAEFQSRLEEEEAKAEAENMEKAILALEMPLLELVAEDLLTSIQIKEMKLCLKEGLDEDIIKKIIHPANSWEKMEELREIAMDLRDEKVMYMGP